MNQEPLPNLKLSHYRIVSKIGAGGMGEVYYLYALAHSSSGMYKEALALTEQPLQANPANQLMLQVADA